LGVGEGGMKDKSRRSGKRRKDRVGEE